MVKQHVRRSGVVRARVIAHHRVKAERRADAFRLEPLLEQLGGAAREKEKEIAPRLHVERLEQPARLQGAQQVDEAAADVRRALQRQLAQRVRNAPQDRPIVRQPLGVARGKARQLALRGLQAAAHLQIAVFERQEVGQRALDDAQAMLREAQVADHLGLQQADGVSRNRIAEPGMELRAGCRAADGGAALEHFYLEAGLRQIAGTGEAVVPGADDDCIVALHPRPTRP